MGRSRRENFAMRESATREPRVPSFGWLFSILKSLRNKGWERRVPAAAVIPAPQVVVAFIGPKTSVAGLVHSWVNQPAQLVEFCEHGQTWDRERCGVLSG